MGHLANATQQSDCLVVICGADGSGKTTLLNRHIASLGDDIFFARIDHTCDDDQQFYCSFLSQLGFGDITGNPDELRRITKEFLIHRGSAGDPVVLMLDNANLISPKVLEQLRWVSTITVDDTRAISIILAGNSDLMRIMDSPAMSEVKFRSHVRFNIRAYSEEETANYVRHRLKLAGSIDAVKFSSEAHPLIYRYTGGIPRLINMLCNAVLTEAHAASSRVITEDLVRGVADSRRLVPHMVPLQGKGRRRTDPGFKFVQSERQTEGSLADTETTFEKPFERPRKASGQTDPEKQSVGKEDDLIIDQSAQKLRPKDRQRITPSPLIPTVDTKVPEVDVTNLLEQVSRLSEQLGELKAERKRAVEDVSSRDDKLRELREKLSLQSAETEKLVNALEGNAGKIEQLSEALSVNKKALHKSEKTSMQLAAELQKERGAAESALNELAKAKATSEELSHLKAELQSAVDAFTGSEKRVGSLERQLSDLAEANSDLATDLEMERRAAETALGELAEAKATVQEFKDLKAELQSAVDALADREQHVADLEGQLSALAEANSDLAVDLEMERSAAETVRNELAEAKAKTEELGDLKAELESAFDTLASSEQHVVGLERQLSDLAEANDDLAAALEKERSAAKTALNDLSAARATTQEFSNLKTELQSAVDALAGSEQQVESLERQLSELAEANDGLAAALEKERTTLQTALNERVESEATTHEFSDLTAELQSAVEALADSEQHVESLERQLSELAEANDGLAAALEKERTTAQTALNERVESEATTHEFSDLTAELQSAVEALADSERHVDSLERQLSDLAEASSDLVADLELANEQIGRIDILEQAAADREDEIEKQASELVALRGEVENRDEVLDDLASSLRAMQDECESLRVRVATAESLEESISDKDARIAEMESKLVVRSQEISSLEAKNQELDLARQAREEDLDRLLNVEENLIASQERIALLEEELELRARELAAADNLAGLELELQEARHRLAAAEAELAVRSPAFGPDLDVDWRKPDIRAFEVIKDGKIEQIVKVGTGQWRMMVGRSEDSELYLNSKYVSRHHALIICSEQAIYIEDLNSSNGTAVNSKIVARCDLRPGDVITIGDYRIKPSRA